MRSRPLMSGMLDGGDGRHSYEDRRSLSRCGLDLQGGADERGAFLHPEQTESPAVAFGSAGIESYAIVLDDERDVIGAPLEDDFDMAGFGVLGDVVERFLGDAVERGLDLGW